MFDIFHKHLDDAVKYIKEDKFDKATAVMGEHREAATSLEDGVLGQIKEKVDKYRLKEREMASKLDLLHNPMRPEIKEKFKQNVISNINKMKKILDEIKELTDKLKSKEKQLE